MVNDALFSSDSDEWATPQALFDRLDAIYQFTLDPCASAANHKCKRWFSKEQDGLTQRWYGERVFVNPPYSQIALWVAKCAREALASASIVILLIPSRTDTRYWHDYIWDESNGTWRTGVSGNFLRGRLHFNDSRNSAPFPSVVITFRPL